MIVLDTNILVCYFALDLFNRQRQEKSSSAD